MARHMAVILYDMSYDMGECDRHFLTLIERQGGRAHGGCRTGPHMPTMAARASPWQAKAML